MKGAPVARAQLAAPGAPVWQNYQQPIDYGTDKIAAFLTKTYEMVNSEPCSHLISWGDRGDSFLVLNKERLALEVLPQFFKHNNFSSFIRQLNMYGFRKIGDPQHWEFSHEAFVRGKPELLKLIKRKSVTNKPKAERERQEREKRAGELAMARNPAGILGTGATANDVDASVSALALSLQKENRFLKDELQRLRDSMQNIEKFLQRQFPATEAASARRGVKRDRATAVGTTSGFELDESVDPSRDENSRVSAKRPRPISVNIPNAPFGGVSGGLETGYTDLPSLGLTPKDHVGLPQHMPTTLPTPSIGVMTPKDLQSLALTPKSPGLLSLLHAANPT